MVCLIGDVVSTLVEYRSVWNINYMRDNVVVEFGSSTKSKEEIENRLVKSGYKFVRTLGRLYP